MRRVLVCLVVSGLSVLALWGCKHVLDFDEDEAPAKKGKPKEQDFRFVKGGRRDPFSPFFGGPPPPKDCFTPDDLRCAMRMLADIRTEFREFRGNPSPYRAGQVHKSVDSLETFLGRPCAHTETEIHVAELKRRARNYHTSVDETLFIHDTMLRISQADVWLAELAKLVEAGKIEEVDELLQKIETSMQSAGTRLPTNPLVRKKLLERIRAILQQIAAPRIKVVTRAAEHILVRMRQNIRTRNFEAVSTDYDLFCIRLETLPDLSASPQTSNERRKIDHLIRRAKDIHKQAQFAMAKSQLDEIEATIAQAESCLLCDEFDSSIEHANDAVRSLRAQDIPRSMEARKGRLLRRAQDLALRASIRMEFLKHPPAIAGVGFQPGNSVVLVNNKVAREGDQLDSHTQVRLIASTYVVFTYKGESIRVASGW